MRNAAARTTETVCYSTLVDGCKHSRLREALGAGLPPASARTTRAYSAPVAYNDGSVTAATKAYFLVAGMSVASLLGIVVAGAIAIG